MRITTQMTESMMVNLTFFHHICFFSVVALRLNWYELAASSSAGR